MKRDNSVYIVDVLIEGEYRFMLVHIYVNSNLVHSTYTTLVSVYILYSCKEVCEVLLCKCSKIQCKSYSIISPVNILFFFFCLSLVTLLTLWEVHTPILPLSGPPLIAPLYSLFLAPINCLSSSV